MVVKAQAARKASRLLARMSTNVKNRALLNIAEALESQQGSILDANQRDYRAAKEDGLNDAMLDRLLLTPQRLNSMAQDVRSVAALPDPIGEIMDATTLPKRVVSLPPPGSSGSYQQYLREPPQRHGGYFHPLP